MLFLLFKLQGVPQNMSDLVFVILVLVADRNNFPRNDLKGSIQQAILKTAILQGVPQNMSDLVFWIFNPLKCISERKYGQFWKAEDLTIPKHTSLF